MDLRSPSVYANIPKEYRKAAESIFPSRGFPWRRETDIKATVDFAKALGIDGEYTRLLSLENNSGEMKTFLEHFQNNLDLLIQKTWVEKAEEDLKDKLQDKVPPFVASIEQGNFSKGIEEFGEILEELAYLFFGAQSGENDFTEYAFRIDAQMGLFWWYGGRLASLKEMNEKKGTRDDRLLWAVLLLGICYLTNF
ncbi:MAG: hypothetical protein LBU82_03465 [Treponema sp.]|jgi:hypothetical protein|nr:hypothetical protein [Treponema sp.]